MTPRQSVRKLSDDERWPPGQRDINRCACGQPCRYQEPDGTLTCDDHTTALVRISCDLPSPLVARLSRQAESMELPRNYLLQTAVEGLVRNLEACDEPEPSPPAGKVKA